jgi:DNA repair exonuclease SbcCD ATPase subunit
MIKLKKLRLKAFRSFAEETEIDFPEKGFVLLKGLDPSTGESSGTGKSNILLAIAYALDICPLSATDLQSWLTEEPLQVQLMLGTPGGDVVISRGKKNCIKVGDSIITSAKAISAEITKIFGLSPETLKAITYRHQKSDGLFLSLTDAEKKEFLTKILGLEDIEIAVDKAEATLKSLQPQLDSKNKELEGVINTLDLLKSQVLPELLDTSEAQSLADETQDSLGAVVMEIKRLQTEAAATALKEVDSPEVSSLEEMLAKCKSLIAETSAADKVKEAAFRVEQEKVKATLKAIAYKETTKVSVVKDITLNKKALEKTLAGACPTCERTWDEAKAKAEELQKVILNLEAHLESLAFTEDKAKLEAEARVYFSPDPTISQLKDTADEIQSQIRAKRIALTSASAAKFQAVVSELSIKKAVLENEYKNLLQKVVAINQQNYTNNNILSHHQQNLKKTKENQVLTSKAISDLTLEINAEKDFVSLMGREGFLGVIFDEVLHEVEAEANSKLGGLANVSGVTLQFKSESVSQKGAVKKSITPVISVLGHEGKLNSLSGGMTTAMELVVDLAVTSVIQRRTGSLPGFMILDEVLTGLGTVSAEGALDVLKAESENKLILMIEHGTEFKELFTETVEVVCTNGLSRVVQ